MNMSIGGATFLPPIPSPAQAGARPSIQSQLSNGAEELTFGRTQDTSRPRREVSKALPHSNRFNKVQQVLALMRTASATDLRYGRLQRLARSVISSRGDISLITGRSDLSPEDRMLALQCAFEETATLNDDAVSVQRRIIEAQQALDEDFGEQIRARLHAMEIAISMGESTHDIDNFQTAYLAVLAQGSCAAMLDEILKHFRKRLRRALKMLTLTLGRELDSNWTSCPAEYLHLIRQMLYETSSIANVLDECETLCSQWEDRQGMRLNDPVEMTRDLVKIAAEPWVVPARFVKMADTFVASPWRLRFLGRVRTWMQNMPDKLFMDDASRTRVAEAIQEALDKEADIEPL